MAFDPKQTFEAYFLEFDFTALFGEDAAEDIDSAVVTATDIETGADATSTVTDDSEQVIDGKKVYVWVKAGSNDQTYKITVKATGNGSPASKYELDGELPVREL